MVNTAVETVLWMGDKGNNAQRRGHKMEKQEQQGNEIKKENERNGVEWHGQSVHL